MVRRAEIYMPRLLMLAAALLGHGATDGAEQGESQCQRGRCGHGEDPHDRLTDITAALEGVRLLWPFSVYHAQLADPAAVQVCSVSPRASARPRALAPAEAATIR